MRKSMQVQITMREYEYEPYNEIELGMKGIKS